MRCNVVAVVALTVICVSSCWLGPKCCRAATIFAEDFEGLALGASVDEQVAAENVWTKTPPTGWVADDSGVPGVGTDADGVTEWAGWSFPNKDWWVQTAEDQNRSQFTNGVGTVAVADPDEWDDQDHADSEANGWYDTFLSTPPISLAGVQENTATLTFDSSWRPEFDSNYHQTANITVSFDGADPIEVMRWESDSGSANFKPDSTNETVSIALNNPPGAGSMAVTFGLFDAGNDWWWAVDNIAVTAVPEPASLVLAGLGLVFLALLACARRRI